MTDLESKIQITEKDLDKSRKDFERSSLVLHFGGEIIGALYYTLFKGMTLPCIQNILGYSDDFDPDYKSIAIGLAVYAIPQIPAFFLKGLAMTQDENMRLANKFEIQASKEKDKERHISSYLTRKMSDLHYNFATNYQKYERVTRGYAKAKKKALMM